MDQLLTPKQVGQAIGVSESSLKRWCDRGVLPSSRTVGGHRRIPLASVIGYLRERNVDPSRPDILGLPSRSVLAFSSPSEAVQPLVCRLIDGDLEGSRSVIVNLFMSGASIASIGDELLSPAMSQVGSHWESGDVQIYQERRAVGVTTRVLHEFSRLLPRSDPDASRAIVRRHDGSRGNIVGTRQQSK